MGCTNSTLQKQTVAQPVSSPPSVAPSMSPTSSPQTGATQAGHTEAIKPSAEKPASPTSTATPGEAAAPAGGAVASAKGAASVPKQLCDFRRQRTVVVDQQDLELMVTSYSCHDATMLSSLGKHCKESTWNVQVGLHAEPVEIKVHVDATMLTMLRSPEVSITSRLAGAKPSESTRIFPQGSAQKARLREDFQYTWPYRGLVAGIGERGRYEVRLPNLVWEAGLSEWFPATLLQQRSDGHFKVRATVLDAKQGWQELSLPAVKAADIRMAGSFQPLVVPEQALVLQVPASDPLMAKLSAGGDGEMFTKYLARPSLKGGKREAVDLQVSKRRDVVRANVGYSAFSALHSSSAFSVPSDTAQYQRRAWTLHLGPNVSHTVEIERKHWVGADSRVITLTVDGDVLVEASTDDMKTAGSDGQWLCNFRFVAGRELNFQVHECNVDGETSDRTSIITRVLKSTHSCTVVIPDEWNFHSAQFFVDGRESHELSPYTEPHQEESLSMPLHAFEQEFGIRVPVAVNQSLPAMSNLFSFGEVVQVAECNGPEVPSKALPHKEACGGLVSVLLGACTEGLNGKHQCVVAAEAS